MDKLTITIPDQEWRGIRTKYPIDSPRLTQDDFLSGSTNFDCDVNGSPTKRSGGVLYATEAHPIVDQYEAVFNDGTHYLLEMENGILRYSTGGGTMASITSGYTATGNMEFSMYQDRVYFDNGIDAAQVLDKTAVYGGVTYTGLPKTRAAGAQVPASALTSALASDSTINQIPAGGHKYKVTYLYYGAQESNGRTASTLVTNDGTHTSNALSAIPIGAYGVTARKIYRDNNDGVYLLVATIADNTTTTYTDKASIGTSLIPTANDVPPLFTLITTNLDRLWVAGVPGSPTYLFWSDPGLPDIFNPLNYVLCNPTDPITGIVVYNGRVIVFNRRSLGQILGSTSTTFKYSPIPSSIGCVDNRSIQICTVGGVPVLRWLSDKGVYQYNGNSIDYVSDDIEDLVNLTLQQTANVKGLHTDDTEADFENGTPSVGIDLTDDPGFITTVNPEQIWQSEPDWTQTGTVLTDLATEDGSNTLKNITAFTPALADGTLTNLDSDGTNLTIPVSTDWTGELAPLSNATVHNAHQQAAQSIQPPRAGTITGVKAGAVRAFGYSVGTIKVTVWDDAAGSPGTVLAQSSNQSVPGDTNPAFYPLSCSLAVTANQKLWIGWENFAGGLFTVPVKSNTALAGSQLSAISDFSNGPWYEFTSTAMAVEYDFTATPNAASGQWQSPVDDTFSTNITTGMSLDVTASYPTDTSATVTVQGTNTDPTLITTVWTTTDTLSSPNGSTSLTGGTYRYWQILTVLNTTDDRVTSSVSAPILKFNTTGVWTSEEIDTKEPSAYSALTAITTIPATTGVTVEIATSATSGSGYSAYGPFSGAVVERYAKFRLTLTASTDDTLTPIVTRLTFTWAISATFISQIIDTGKVPAGWGLFVPSYELNGGTATFYVRSAATSGAISGATWVAITPGTFIPVSVYEFIQYKIVVTSAPDEIPLIDSVTINWFILASIGLRVASAFNNSTRAYYLAVAKYGDITNTLLLKLEENGTWKIYSNLDITTMGFFFDELYYGSHAGNIVLFNSNMTDFGTPIVMDVRMPLKIRARKNNDLDDRVKILRDVTARVVGTGATYYFYYSVDLGATWVGMVDVTTGLQYFVTVNDGLPYAVRVVPQWTDGAAMASGRTLMIRVVDSSVNSAQLRSLKARVWVREQEVLTHNG